MGVLISPSKTKFCGRITYFWKRYLCENSRTELSLCHIPNFTAHSRNLISVSENYRPSKPSPFFLLYKLLPLPTSVCVCVRWWAGKGEIRRCGKTPSALKSHETICTKLWQTDRQDPFSPADFESHEWTLFILPAKIRHAEFRSWHKKNPRRFSAFRTLNFGL